MYAYSQFSRPNKNVFNYLSCFLGLNGSAQIEGGNEFFLNKEMVMSFVLVPTGNSIASPLTHFSPLIPQTPNYKSCG